mmetsp:Transcript_4998/g.7326  ORF Transcript_4998/g.7326 Transcript_4998/m.7326 type:complete len:181 (-) Transcript_4998:35-577(-)
MGAGNLHGQGSCFLPLRQLDQEYHAPRIVQIAGAYPGITVDEFNSVTSEPPAEMGQWSYDFSDPDGPQMGTVAIEGSEIVSKCEDPVVIIAEHNTIGVELPPGLEGAVDLVVLVDRAKNRFKERKFLVVDDGSGNLAIGAYHAKSEVPGEILGQIEYVQIPWLPCMKSTKSGFMEEDELF